METVANEFVPTTLAETSSVAQTSHNPAPPSTEAQPKKPGLIRQILQRIYAVWEWCFGVVSIVFILAFLATFPLINLMSLGYLLEVSGRIARTGKFSQGFVGIRTASRLGGMLLGTWLLFLPIRALSDAWQNARIIDPTSPQTQTLWAVTVMATILMSMHVAWACYRGGGFFQFVWPEPFKFFRTIVHGGMYAEAREKTLELIRAIRPWYYFSLGFRGFVGTLAWLALPVVWMIAVRQIPNPGGAFVLSLPGMLAFSVVLTYLPFLQAHFAAENRISAFLELGTIRRRFRQAPLAWWLALVFTLLMAIPLYLLKIELIDREIAWLPSLFFVMFMFPARLVSGWAFARSQKRDQPVHLTLRWLSRFAAVPVVISYVFFMYLSLYISWRGAASLFEQHAFLVPVPFLGG